MMQQYSDGVADWSFTEDEILNEFYNRNLVIPESLLIDFRNTWRIKRNKLL